MLAYLLRHRFQLWLRRTFRSGGRWQGLILFVVVAAVAYLVFQGSSSLFAELIRSSPSLVEPLLSLMFGGLVLIALLSGFSLMLHELFLRSDLELLLAAPVSLRTLFGVKLIEGMAAVGAFAGLLGITALAGYARASGAPLGVALTGLIVLAALLIATTALAMLAILLVTRVVPPGRVRGALAALGALAGAGIWLSFMLVNTASESASLGTALGPMIESWRGAIWSPTTWAADALTSVQAGRWQTFALDIGLLGALTLGLTALSYVTFARTFYLGHGRVRDVGQRDMPDPGSLSASRLSRALRFLPPPMRAVAIKDWRTLRRDLRMLSQLIFPLVITGFVVFSIATNEGMGQATAQLSDQALYWLFLAPLAMLTWFVVGEISIYAFGWEGQAFAILRIGPIRPGRVLLAKGLTSFVPLMTVFGAGAIGIGIWQGVSPVHMMLGVAGLAWVLAGTLAIVTSTAALMTRFDAEHPRQSVGLFGSLPALAASAVFILASALAVLRLAGVALPFLPGWPTATVGLILLVVVAGIGLLVRMATRRIERWPLE